MVEGSYTTRRRSLPRAQLHLHLRLTGGGEMRVWVEASVTIGINDPRFSLQVSEVMHHKQDPSGSPHATRYTTSIRACHPQIPTHLSQLPEFSVPHLVVLGLDVIVTVDNALLDLLHQLRVLAPRLLEPPGEGCHLLLGPFHILLHLSHLGVQPFAVLLQRTGGIAERSGIGLGFTLRFRVVCCVVRGTVCLDKKDARRVCGAEDAKCKTPPQKNAKQTDSHPR